LVAGLAALGCEKALTMYPPLENCPNGKCGSSGGLGAGVGTGTGGAGTTTGAGGEVALGTLTGTVERLTNPDFVTTVQTPLTTPANIVIQPATGPQISTPYGGSNGTTFTAANIPSGLAWVYVQDLSNGGAQIWSTISQVMMPQIASVVVPAVDQGLFASVDPSMIASTLASHVVLLLRYSGMPYKGLQVTGGFGGAVLLYDTGPGVYAEAGTATGTGGSVILYNSGLTGLVTISLYDPTLMHTYHLPVMTAAGAVTVAVYDL
jgi:hypothetical protein